MTTAPSAPPADWRERYGFDKGLTPQQMYYWGMNGANGQLGAASVNEMPFVLNPWSLNGLNREANTQQMYKPPGVGMGGGGGDSYSQFMQNLQAGGDPGTPLLQLLKQSPQLGPALMQGLPGTPTSMSGQSAGPGGGDPLSMILGLVEKDPALKQSLLQRLGSGQPGMGGGM